MIGDVVAQRYAQALFAVGKEQGMAQLESYGQTLAALSALIGQSPDLERLLSAPVISVAEKQTVLDRILSALQADITINHFCRLLAEKERLGLFRNIATAFGRQLDTAAGVVRGTLVTAVALDEQRHNVLAAELGKKMGATLALQYEVDPSILGGLVLRLGDTLMDASLKAQLAVLTDTIKRGE